LEEKDNPEIAVDVKLLWRIKPISDHEISFKTPDS